MANKQYISPIRLFLHSEISYAENFNLSRAKKQLQAEFSIAQDGFINIDGYSYDRQYIFAEIERPDFAKRLVFHNQVWLSQPLLHLLEGNSAQLSGLEDELKPFSNNIEFDEFFSPYFAGPFIYLSRSLLAQNDFEEAGNLLAYENFLLPAEREEAFRPIQQYMDENLRLLRNVNGANFKLLRPQIVQWIEHPWHLFFNNLPPEFYEQKTDIAKILINLTVAIQKSNRKDCRLISEKLVALQDMPANISELASSNHVAYTGSSKTFSLRNNWWVIWIFIMVIRALSSDSCNNREKVDLEFTPTDIRYSGSDSIFKKLIDSNARNSADTLSNYFKTGTK